MFAVRRLSALTAVAVLFFASVALAQNNRIWFGSATPDNKWTTVGNWNLGVPVSGDTAFFNNAGAANTTVSLGGAAQPINTIEFDNGITPAYTLGVLGSGDKFNVDAGGSILVTETVATLQTINADLQLTGATISNSGDLGLTLGGNIVASGILTVTNPTPSTTTTFNGNITEVSGQPASLTLSATGTSSTGNSFVFNGTNTYTGGTTITVNTGSGGSIQVGSNSPFGTGLVTVNAATLAPQFSSVGGDHTIPNPISLNAGITPTGSNSLSFLGPIVISNAAANGSRIVANQITTAGKSITFGVSPNSSTITLGAGDGIGKGLVFTPVAGSTTVVNDVIQDPAAGGGAASGNVQVAGGVGAVTKFAGLNTYTGGTMLNGSSTVQIASDSNAGSTAGPFGTGTLTFNNTTNNILQPVGGNRLVANPISMVFGMTTANAPSDTSGLTFSGAITQGVTGRSITNNMTGTLTLGAAATPSTFTLPTSGSQSVAIVGTGATVINDVIQDAAGPPTPATTISYSGTGSVTLNAQNTYAGDTLFNGSSIVKFSTDSNAGGTAGPFGQGTLKLNSSTNNTLEPIGGVRMVSNPVSMQFGLTVANVTGDTSGLVLSGPITLGASGRTIANNFVGGTLTLGSVASPSTWTLPTTSGQTVSIIGGGATVIDDVIQDAAGATSPATTMAYGGTGLVVLNGHNTYAGNTLLNGSSSIQFSTDYVAGGTSGPFGLGNINFNSMTNTTLVPTGGNRTLANPLLMSFGMKFANASAETSNLTLTGPITSAANGRTITNNMAGTLTLGSSASPSTWTLPTTSGQTTAITGGGATVINDVIQDPGTFLGPQTVLAYSGTGSVIMNSHNTYVGDTLLNGSSVIQFSTDYASGGTSGPFGLGNINFNSSNNSTLEPIGGDRVLANPVLMNFGLKFGNVASDSSNLTMTGPITMAASGRTLTNNMTGTLTLGSAGTPSTWTLPTTGGQTVSFIGSGSTVVNDVIQNAAGAPSPATALSLTGSGAVAFNALNTYTGDTTVAGLGEPIRLGTSSNALPGASFTAGPVGTGNLILNNTTTGPVLQPVGADRMISNSVTLTSGFTASNLSGTPYSLTLAGPITLGATSRIISNNIPNAANLVLGAAAAPATFTIGSTITIQSQVAGAGSTIINDKVTGAGGMTIQGGAVVQLNNAANDFVGTTLVTGIGSKLLVNGGKTGAGAITINSGGTLGGSGAIVGAIANSGTIAPGIPSSGAGTLTATGNVTMAANSHLAIDLAGGSADKLVVGGNLDLSNVDFLDISGTRSGVSFVIASYTGTLTGTFNNVTAGYTVNYGTGTNSQITLNIPLSNVKGDFNNNGKVDAADYVLWRNNLGTTNALPNDNGLGTPISQSHYNLWRANFNLPGSGSGALTGGEVPEPGSFLLVAAAIASSLMTVRTRLRAA